MTTSTSEPHALADPHGLVATGEPRATIPELARRIGCSGRALHSLLGGRLKETVRHVRYSTASPSIPTRAMSSVGSFPVVAGRCAPRALSMGCHHPSSALAKIFRSSSLTTYSKAPRLMASTAYWTPPAPVMAMNGNAG
jgi:hypothetical protein